MGIKISVRSAMLAGTFGACFALALGSSPVRAAEPNFDALLDKLFHSSETETYRRLTNIQVPGSPLAVFDISYVDERLPLYYLADRSNAALDVVDVRDNTVAAQIKGFVGVRNDPVTGKVSNAISGPDGVQPVGLGEVWVGDGDSSVKVVDLFSQSIVAKISTLLPGHTADQDKRADELSYDSRDQLLLAANNAATPPFVTLISTRANDRKVVKQIVYADAAGVEASVWDPSNGMFYINLTQVGSDPNNGAISIVDPRQGKEIGRFTVTGCNGAGLSLAPGHKLLVGCSLNNGSQIIDSRNGTLLATIPQISGSDETWYNPGDHKFYLAARSNPASAGGPVLGVINAENSKFVTAIPTDASSHSVAADRRNNHIFVPFGPVPSDPTCTKGCIAVFVGHEKESRLERDVEKFLTSLEDGR